MTASKSRGRSYDFIVAWFHGLVVFTECRITHAALHASCTRDLEAAKLFLSQQWNIKVVAELYNK